MKPALQKKLNHIDRQNNLTDAQFDDFLDYFLTHNYKFVIRRFEIRIAD